MSLRDENGKPISRKSSNQESNQTIDTKGINLLDYYDLDLLNHTYTVQYVKYNNTQLQTGASFSSASNYVVIGKNAKNTWLTQVSLDTGDKSKYVMTAGGAINIGLIDIKDGRCPSDVDCVWSGNVIGKFVISNPQNPIPSSSFNNTV